ncbi:uncharacterized protein LOC124287059 [Haliotis rubra]|uniref:uncharacterized protein LOC124287059 n=1 Tax=Haliotis rubra TaxID=36100 RepID=UPI001EE56174|nr:uncharacterized protein LOC124287059 [Haliotis rubra]XP_046579488.1 uncharacterized protein LOC124287059 [Haliotis rubra]
MATRKSVSERVQIQTLVTKGVQTETHGSATFPSGLSDGLDLRTSLVSPIGVFRLLLRGRTFVFLETDKHPPFMDNDKLTTDKLLFLVSGELSLSSSMYNPRLPKYPAEVQTRFASFRTSSFVWESILKVPGAPHVTASLKNNGVAVSKSTRRPCPVPDWFREKFGQLYNKDPGVTFRKVETTPIKMCRGVNSNPYLVTVKSRDIDVNQHTNAVLYLQYCLDALDDHLFRNKIQCELNTESLLLKSASFLHMGESEVADVLAVEFWDDETDADMICFNIVKSGISIYQARIRFYRYDDIFEQTSRL